MARAQEAIGILLLLQMGIWISNPLPKLPDESDRGKTDYLFSLIKEIKGPVLFAEWPNLTFQAGKPLHFGRNGLHALIYGRSKYLNNEGMPQVLSDAITSQYFSAIFFEYPTLTQDPLLATIQKAYQQKSVVPAISSGWNPNRPIEIYFPKPK